MMTLRLAKMEDTDALLELRYKNAMYHANVISGVKLKDNTDKFLYKHTQEAIENPDKRIFVIIENEKVLAYIIAALEEEHLFLDFGKQGIIHDIYVSPKIQKTGSGRTLLNIVLKWFKEEGVKTVKLNVYLENTIGVNFWKKSGFKILSNNMIKQL